MLVKLLTKLTIAVTLLSMLGVAALGQQQKQQKSPWKDRAEYDLYTSITKAKDNPAKQLQLLDTYIKKYPQSNFKEPIYFFYTLAYQKLKQADKMYESALKLLEVNPKNVQGMIFITSLTISRGKTDPESLATGEKWAKALLRAVEPMKKPAKVSEATWKKQKTGLLVLAHQTLGWIAMNRKNNAEAEREFRTVLKLNPNNGQVSYWLGTVIIAQRDPSKQLEAFYHFARASGYTGPGAMPPAGRKQVASYLKKIYVGFHGDESGLNDLLALSQKSAFPPPDLVIKSKEQLKVEAEEKLKRENPKLALWLSIKKQLLADNGMEYFNSSVKNTAVPALRGYLIAQSPPRRPDTLVLGLSDRSTREVTLKLDQAFRYPAGRGTVINFRCVPRTFTKQPFNLTFECEHAKVTGWPPPPKRKKRR